MSLSSILCTTIETVATGMLSNKCVSGRERVTEFLTGTCDLKNLSLTEKHGKGKSC